MISIDLSKKKALRNGPTALPPGKEVATGALARRI